MLHHHQAIWHMTRVLTKARQGEMTGTALYRNRFAHRDRDLNCKMAFGLKWRSCKKWEVDWRFYYTTLHLGKVSIHGCMRQQQMLVVMIKVNWKEGSVAKNLVLGGNGCEMGDGGTPPCFAFCAPALSGTDYGKVPCHWPRLLEWFGHLKAISYTTLQICQN